MIATMVFSVVLLLCSVGLIQIGKIYLKGVTSTRTQEAARSIIEEISRGVQFSGGSVVDTTGSTFCIDTTRYSYVVDRQRTDDTPTADQSKHVLVADNINCSPAPSALPVTNPAFNIADPTLTNARELLPLNMRLTELTVTLISDDLYKVTVGVANGEEDLFEAAVPHETCKSGNGGQFCASSKLSTFVQKRVK